MKLGYKQQNVINEIKSRLANFHNNDVNKRMILLAYKTEANLIKKLDLIKPYSTETNGCLNWYDLTENGKNYFINLLK